MLRDRKVSRDFPERGRLIRSLDNNVQFVLRLVTKIISFSSKSPTVKSANQYQYICPECHKRYKSIAGFRGHVTKKHQRPDIKATLHLDQELTTDDFTPFYPEDNLRDLTDFVLQAKKDADEENSDAAEMLSDVHIRQTIGDMFGAGVDTSRLTLYWCVYFMASNPDIQKKVHDENLIDSIVGRNRLSRLKDKAELPYTDATMHECMRIGVVAPIGIPHTAMVDSTLGGYDIPKGTTVAVNVYALHKDPKYWKDTDDFMPERFQENGRMGPKPISFMSFSAGRRVCRGIRGQTRTVAGLHLHHASFPNYVPGWKNSQV